MRQQSGHASPRAHRTREKERSSIATADSWAEPTSDRVRLVNSDPPVGRTRESHSRLGVDDQVSHKEANCRKAEEGHAEDSDKEVRA